MQEDEGAIGAGEAPVASGGGSVLHAIAFLSGPAALIAWLAFGPQTNLSPEAHRLAGIMLFTIVWWITEPIPIAATALAAIVLCAILGAVPADATGRFTTARTLLAPFGDPSVFFLLGGLFIGQSMSRHGLDRRLALGVLKSRWAGRSPFTILCAVGLAVTLVSTGISNTAATAMMYPVTLGMIAVFETGRGGGGPTFARSGYASGLLLITAYASSVGGVATPIGTATNMVAMGYFRQPAYFGQPIDFLRWSMVGVPMMLCIFAGMIVWLRLLTPMDDVDLPALRSHIHRSHAELGPWKLGEVNTLVVFGVMGLLWLIPGFLALFAAPETQEAYSRRFPEEVIALLAPVLLFVLPSNWRNRKGCLESVDFRRVDWSTVLLFGAALALGNLMFRTGLAQHVGQATFDWLDSRDVWIITALAIASGILLSEFTSNASTAATLIPVILALCQQAGVDPRPPLLGVTFGASFGSALPVSTPPNAIVYGSGLLPIRRMVVAGIGVDAVAGVAVWVVLRIAFGLSWSPFER